MPAPVAGKRKAIGSPHWTSGPLAIVPSALHALWSTDFTAADGKALGKLKKRVVVARSRGTSGVMFPLFGVGACFIHGTQLVLVEARDADGRSPVPLGPVMAAAVQVDVADRAWKLVTTYSPSSPHVLCNAWAKNIGGGKHDRKQKLALALAMQRYVIEEAKGIAHRVKPYPNKAPIDVKYTFTRLRPQDAAPPTPKAKKASTPPAATELVATSEIIKAAKRLAFVGSDQTSIVIMPRAALRSWGGIGTADYDRASAVRGAGVIDVDGSRALVIGMDSAMAFHPTANGGLVLMWVAADTAAGVLASVLSIPEDHWKPTTVTWDVGDGKLVMIGAPTVGKSAGKARADIALARGRYSVETCWRWEGDVRVGAKTEATMVAALRLSRC